MELILNFVGIIVIALLALYGFLYLVYRVVILNEESEIPPGEMPVLRPLPIPTKKQKTWLNKLLDFFFEVREWKLAENWHYNLDGKEEIVIPKGFTFDGASIPRPLWGFLSPVGVLLIPGLLHDYGYRHDQLWKIGDDGCPVAYKKGAGKEYWDQLFEEVGDQVNGVDLVNWIAKFAVAVGGKSAWKKYQKAKENAVEPILSSCEPPKDT